MRGTLSISISVGNSRLSLVAALKDRSLIDGFSSKFKKIFIAFTPAKITCFTILGARKWSAEWVCQ